MNNTNNKINFRNLYAFGKKLPIDLSLSENPFGCSKKIGQFIKKSIVNFNDYPDPKLNSLKEAIANKLSISKKRVFISNGSESILSLITKVLPSKNDNVIIPCLTFPLFKVASKLNTNKVIFSKMKQNLQIDIKDIKNRINQKTKLIFLCNPNNPTGLIISNDEIINLLRFTKSFVVIDEANIEFDGLSMISQLKKFNNLIIIKTFSKGFGLAGLRIGFCLANPQIIDILEKNTPPFPISSLSEKIAVIALSDDDFIKKSKQLMKIEINFLKNELKKRGFEFTDSNSNNLFINISSVAEKPGGFIKKINLMGVSIVEGKSFNKKFSNFIRISPRTRKVNLQFLKIMDKIIKVAL